MVYPSNLTNIWHHDNVQDQGRIENLDSQKFHISLRPSSTPMPHPQGALCTCPSMPYSVHTPLHKTLLLRIPVGVHTGTTVHPADDRPREEAHTGPGSKLGAIWKGFSGVMGT